MGEEPNEPRQEPASPPEVPRPDLPPQPDAQPTPAFELPPVPPRPRARRLRTALIIAIAAIVTLAGGTAVAVLLALRGTSDVMEKSVPGNVNVYVTAYLDPSAGQKLALLALAKKFPQLATDTKLSKRVDDVLDDVLEGSGLRASDVRPWLGSQVAVIVRVQEGHSLVAIMIASRDDQRALAAMAKFRAGPEGSSETWSQRSHGGVTISVGSSGGSRADAYALVGHIAVLANDAALIDDVIDTQQGKMASIFSSARYAKTLAGLPTDRLALAYVDLRSLAQQIDQGLQEGGFPDGLLLPSSFGQIDAFTGLGVSLTAHANGISVDASVQFDPAKLTADQRASLQAPPHQNAVLSFTPAAAYGVYTVTDFGRTLRTALQQLSTDDPSFDTVDQQLGLTEAATHLSGDAGFQFGPGPVEPYPAAAFLAATDDEADTKALLGKAATMVVGQLVADGALPRGTGLRQETAPGGVVVTYLSLPELQQFGVTPAYAVSDGMAIIASSPDEIHAILAARTSGTNLTSSPTFQAAFSGVLDEGTLFYADIEAIATAVRDALPPDEQQRYDADAGQYTKALKALAVSSGHGADRQTTRIFLLIP